MEFENACEAGEVCQRLGLSSRPRQGKENNLRHEHQQLLICITDKLWLCVKALLPCLLDYSAASVRFALVERANLVELDLLVYQSL